ncbi:unnamed protein product [Paramecium sonneborni]|uniref:Uncharacterized protein n=1 Tax=Paramecium sonneborni TaxID=65129 RepID=A0A8S1PFG5_9CILI|nr:unnamed protein product [Paramecium sonneborni]
MSEEYAYKTKSYLKNCIYVYKLPISKKIPIIHFKLFIDQKRIQIIFKDKISSNNQLQIFLKFIFFSYFNNLI